MRALADWMKQRTRRREFGSTLVIRNLDDGTDDRIDDVSGFAIDDSAGFVASTVSARTPQADGAYLRTLATKQTATLMAGEGEYKSIVLDRAGAQEAFVSNRNDFTSLKPQYALYHALVKSPTAVLVAAARSVNGLSPSDRGRTDFTRDGSAILFGVAPPLADTIPADSLADKAAVFHEPEKLRPGAISEAVTTEAARRIGDIALALRARGFKPHAVARFLDRVVFCLFAEDIGLLPRGLFTSLLDKTRTEPGRFGRLAGQLFGAMAAGGDFGLETIRRFNGGLFASAEALDLTEDELASVAAAGRLDWSAVAPSIFGTLFVRGLDPGLRPQLGAQYTSRQDIETLLEPVVQIHIPGWEEPLYRERIVAFFLPRLRDEQRFADGGPLRAQLGRDREASEAVWRAAQALPWPEWSLHS